MDTDDQRWDVETAAAWLRRLCWGDPVAQETAPPAPQAAAAQDGTLAGDDVDIACWPALVAPFYD